MLKRFSVTNFSSFRDEQSFDMTAGTTKVLSNHVVNFEKVKLLKSAVIYGANASGKSNLIKSIDFARKVIVRGINNLDTYKKYFRLCSSTSSQNSSFEFEIEIDGKFYAYGFSALLKDKVITEEWLYEIGKTSPELIFERKNKKIELGKLLSLNKNIKNRFEIYLDDMKNQDKQLFLTEIASKELTINAVSTLNSIFKWFEEKLLVVFPETKFNGIKTIDTDITKILKKHLKSFGTGVIGVSTINEDFEKNFKGFPDEFKSDIEKALENSNEIMVRGNGNDPQIFSIYKDHDGLLKVKKLGLIHGGDIEDTFDLKDESDGTRRLIDFIPLISHFSSDYTILIDEFDRSLHPKLTKEFFKLFYNIEQSKTQLIVTSHESTLLDLELLRRDEIWFVDKNIDASSSIYSLNKFQIRYDSKVERAYLLGRYGAIPIINTLES